MCSVVPTLYGRLVLVTLVCLACVGNLVSGDHMTVDSERFAGLNICVFNPIEILGNSFALPWPEVLII